MGARGGCSFAQRCPLQGPAGLSKGLGSWSLYLSFLDIFFVLTESETRFPVWKYSCTKVLEFLSWQLHKISSGSVSGTPLSCQRLLRVEGNLYSYCKTKFLICYTDLAHSTQQLMTNLLKKIKKYFLSKDPANKEKASSCGAHHKQFIYSWFLSIAGLKKDFDKVRSG